MTAFLLLTSSEGGNGCVLVSQEKDAWKMLFYLRITYAMEDVRHRIEMAAMAVVAARLVKQSFTPKNFTFATLCKTTSRGRFFSLGRKILLPPEEIKICSRGKEKLMPQKRRKLWLKFCEKILILKFLRTQKKWLAKCKPQIGRWCDMYASVLNG